MQVSSHENLEAANYLLPDGVSIIVEGNFFSQEHEIWLPTYKIVHPDGHKSGGLCSIVEAIVMGQGNWVDYCQSKK